MIEARFGLKHRPFDKAIDSRKLYLWPGLEELAARLEMGKRSDTKFRLDGGDWLSGMSGSRQRISVSGSGSGLELWADVTIRVPNGAQLTVKHGVGNVIADNVDG